MRPRLHPDMGQVVICARVARQLSAIAWRYNRELSTTMRNPSLAALELLPLDYPGFLRFAVHSLGVYLDYGMSSSQWLANVLAASHFGHSFRRCFFFDYKATRGPYPRVTNRGVPDSPKQARPKSRRAKGNA